MDKTNQLKGDKGMNFLTELLQLPSMWLLVIGIIAVVFVIKLIRSVVAKIMSLVFTAIMLLRVYTFLSDKF